MLLFRAFGHKMRVGVPSSEGVMFAGRCLRWGPPNRRGALDPLRPKGPPGLRIHTYLPALDPSRNLPSPPAVAERGGDPLRRQWGG